MGIGEHQFAPIDQGVVLYALAKKFLAFIVRNLFTAYVEAGQLPEAVGGAGPTSIPRQHWSMGRVGSRPEATGGGHDDHGGSRGPGDPDLTGPPSGGPDPDLDAELADLLNGELASV